MQLQRHQAVSRLHSLAGGREVEASSLVELHVPDTTNGLDLGLAGTEVVIVSVVTALKQVLVASVSRVLVTHPPGKATKKVSQCINSVSSFSVYKELQNGSAVEILRRLIGQAESLHPDHNIFIS